ncbi:hypothetical protein I4U23_008849 [Adineta vaga]|nr:hypothetical protein I4U23_008849 [Adineta vaga]
MSLKRIFSTHSHHEQQRSQNANNQLPIKFCPLTNDENNAEHLKQQGELHSIPEQQNSTQSFSTPNTPGYAREDQHRTRRRSSVQILDKKFIQLLPNQMTSSFIGNNDSNTERKISDDSCEF